MRIYLDNNATTQVHPAIMETLAASFRNVFGNASSIHAEGQSARRAIEEGREKIAALVEASSQEIVFTSGGTESNNAAILGVMGKSDESGHIVTTAIEHPSVLEPVRALERRGHSLTLVACDSRGVVSADAMIAAVRPDTRLVSMMLANNETGVIQPIAAVAAHCRPRGIHVHCDGVQAAGKINIDVGVLGCDTFSISAHKLHAPKGIGALYIRRGVVLEPQLIGGSQERRRRAGTENVPLAVAFGVAAELALDVPVSEIARLRDRLERSILTDVPAARINGAGASRVPNTANVCFVGIDGEGLVIALDLAGVAVSTGAACSSGRLEPSHVLLAMGLSLEDAKGSIRFSLSRFSAEEEIDRVAGLVKEIVPRVLGPRPDRGPRPEAQGPRGT